jgi:heme exporter protein B
MEIKSSSWISKAFWVFQKDIKSELRTRYGLNALVMFAVITLTAVSFAIGQFSSRPKLISSLFWIVIFFSSMSGLAQVFIKEEETKTVNLLKLVASNESIFLGKLFFNLILLFLLEVIIIPLFLILLNVEISNFGLFLSIVILGTVGLVCATTIIAAIVSKARVKGALFAVLSFPILLPLLVTAIHGTSLAIEGSKFSQGWSELKVLLSYCVVIGVGSFLLFDFVWRE